MRVLTDVLSSHEAPTARRLITGVILCDASQPPYHSVLAFKFHAQRYNHRSLIRTWQAQSILHTRSHFPLLLSLRIRHFSGEERLETPERVSINSLPLSALTDPFNPDNSLLCKLTSGNPDSSRETAAETTAVSITHSQLRPDPRPPVGPPSMSVDRGRLYPQRC